MIFDFDYGKLQILTVNIFIILLKASTLNPYKLKSDLEEVEETLHKDCDSLLCHHVLIFFVSLLLIAKFLTGYITLASNIIAMFPILTEALPQLLIPPIFAQAIDNVLLNLFEAILGYFTLYYYAPTTNSKVSVLVIFLASMTIKISMAITTLNIYSDFYQYLNHSLYNRYDSDDSIDNTEKLIRSQYLA